MARYTITDTEIKIETDSYSAIVARTGYVSGVKQGTFRDRRTGAVELGFGLDIADFLLEPEAGKPQDPAFPYHYPDAYHGNIPKRYVELPQICTQARSLPSEVCQGRGFVAVRQWFRWTQATAGYRPGSLWEQVLVFCDGQRHFYSCDRVVSANDAECLLLRIDLPGHLRHQHGDTFESVYLSYAGELAASEFAADFPPDARFLYRRQAGRIPPQMIRAYRTRVEGRPGPWLGGVVLDPATVSEAWCHQRGYVCFITEIGGYPIKAGQSFSAAYAIGYFDSLAEMADVASSLAGKRGLQITGSGSEPVWEWSPVP